MNALRRIMERNMGCSRNRGIVKGSWRHQKYHHKDHQEGHTETQKGTAGT